jgi:hypothetical protein
MGILDSIFDFAGSSKGLVSILAALAGAKDRERDRPPTGGGVSYAMPGPRRLQAVKNLGRYTDVMGLANGGTADEEEAVKKLLYGIAQGPYGPLLAYDIPELNLAPVAPEPEKPRVTQPTKATIDDYGYEYTPPTSDKVGTYNQQINDFLTDLAAGSSYGPTGLAGRGLGHAAEIGLGRLANALGREKTADELANTPIESRDSYSIGSIANALGISPQAAAEIISGAQSEESTVGMDAFGPSGTGGMSQESTVGMDAFGPSGPSSPGPSYDFDLSNAGGYMREGGEVRAYAQGGPIHMEDGGFVLTKRAVDGAGGPRGLAAALPQARMIRGPGTGTSDSIPATISGPRGQTPARVSNGEAYVPRRAVQAAGGPKRMYGLMSALERRA